MHFLSRTESGGDVFMLGDIPGVLWTPGDTPATRPLIVVGHGGGQHKQAPGVVAAARQLIAAGFAVVALDAPHHGDRPKSDDFLRLAAANRARMQAGDSPDLAAMHLLLAEQSVTEWRAVVTAVQRLDRVGEGPVGYHGVSMGTGLGIPFVAAEPRVRAAVLGLLGADGLVEEAARVTVPVRFLVQWDDQLVPRADALALFDALGSTAKSLHANPGNHGEVPALERDDSVNFLIRRLS
ncbi:dienelactone hydrolase family protein [Actinoplanes sp. CA-030573]|uniref:dienelactone hydrolase family protein n=1 Tax=Actinoplanes sp. CA-030573 TaxID=3239898 RepID=UPI003D8BB763